ncbi:hypothetical protein RJ639_036991 [Escallonia herrerae]|uniref:Integrase catalytic domain-containing protein n=1 Tax=Escallonia herrerae TaxID=1293975 RepID=A0AA88WUQ6_9ASTE|nr:hypothetical protein RJ639_036991 [Escallonia herrerae]
MVVAPPSTHHSHLDPSDLRLCLTSRSSYGHKYQSTADPTYNPKEKSRDHLTRSGSCYRRDSSAEDSTNSSPELVARAKTPRRSTHRKGRLSLVPENGTPGRWSLDIVLQNDLPQGMNLDIRCRGHPESKTASQFLYASIAATLEIDNLDESVKYTAFLRSLRPTSKFAFSVNKSPPVEENVAPREGRQQTPPAIEEREDREENAGTINTISGGLAAGGSSGQARKAYAREVCITSQPPNKKQKTVPVAAITFSDEDSKDIKTPHDDPLVITIKAGNFDVKRVLIDNGSFAEVLFYDAFKKMNISTDRLRKMDTPLYGLSNHPVTAEGIIALPVAIGTPPAQANFMLDFVVVKVPSAYNSILGRPALNQLQAVVSTYHLKMKFPTEHGIGEVKGDQTTARQCYVTSCRSRNKEALVIEDLREDTKIQRGEPVEDLVNIEVYPEEENKTVRIDGSSAVGSSGAGIILISPEDTLSRLASAEETEVRRPVYLEFLKDRSISSHAEIEIIDQEPCWMDRIIKYLSTGELPSERHEARNLCIKAARYPLVEGTIYKKSFSLPYLRCLRPSESLYTLQEVHEGICGQHLGGRTLTQKILRQGYYWPTIQKDAIKFTQRCDKCQKFAPVSHTPVAPLTSIASPMPFAVWGMDLLGPFPMASRQRRFVIVAIDYFTKWTEAESLATITSTNCEDFFWKNVVCHFGVPRALVVDNGKQFDNNNFRTFCSNLSIDLRFTSVAHPQSNGQTENMNRSILQGLKKKLDEAKGTWVDELPKVLWAYRKTPHSVTRETPFSLCYGTEAMLPVEIGVPTIRALHFNELNNEVGLRANLDLVEEARTQAHV